MPEANAHSCVVFDLDGTLALFDADRLGHLVHRETKDWAAFHEAMKDAPAIEPVARMLRLLKASGETIVICSGRPAQWEDKSRAWLEANDLPVDAIYLRAPGDDAKSDPDVKRALLEDMRRDGFDPWIIFDDRSSVVAAWRAEGLVCLQCAPGDF